MRIATLILGCGIIACMLIRGNDSAACTTAELALPVGDPGRNGCTDCTDPPNAAEADCTTTTEPTTTTEAATESSTDTTASTAASTSSGTSSSSSSSDPVVLARLAALRRLIILGNQRRRNQARMRTLRAQARANRAAIFRNRNNNRVVRNRRVAQNNRRGRRG